MRLNRWSTQTQHVYATERDDGMILAIIIQREPKGGRLFGVMALESSKEAAEQNGMQGILDNHAHDVIGCSRTFQKAKERAERYVRKWRRSAAAAPLPRCECDVIDAEFVEG